MEKRSTILLSADESYAGEIKGTIFKKQIARFGKWVNPIYPWGSEDRDMILDMEWAKEMIANFNKKEAIQHVPVPLNHTDDVSANTGEVVKLEAIDGDGLYAYIDVRRKETIEEIEAGTIFDVSMSFDWDFVDTENGTHHGIVLLHVALVNNPYLTKMSTFEKVEEALRQLSHRVFKPVGLANTGKTGAIMLSESKAKELRHMLVTIKNNRDFDVTLKYKEGEEEKELVIKAGEEAQVPQDVSEQLLTDIAEAEKPADEDEETPEQKAEREAKEAEDAKKAEEQAKKDQDADEDEKAELSRLRKMEAENIVKEQYNTLFSKGKITPAQKDAFMSLSQVESKGIQLSGKQTSIVEIVSGILEAGAVKFSTDENGSQKNKDGGDEEDNQDEAKAPSENLSAEEVEGLKASGVDIKRMDELAAKYPAMADQLKKNREEK